MGLRWFFWPFTIVYSLIVIVDVFTIIELRQQIDKIDPRRWKYLRLWLFICMAVGNFMLLVNEVLASIPYINQVGQNYDFALHFGTYVVLCGCVISVYLVVELANVHKNRESNPKFLRYGFIVFWIPPVIIEVVWLIYPTYLMQFGKSGLQALYVFILFVIYMWNGGSLLRQLLQSRVLSKKTNALRKLSIMMVVGGILALGVVVSNLSTRNSPMANIWCSFIFETALNVLFVVILGPGTFHSVPFYKKIRPFWKQDNSGLSPNNRSNGDSLSDAFATPSTSSNSPNASQKTMSVEMKQLEEQQSSEFVLERTKSNVDSGGEDEKLKDEDADDQKLVTVIVQRLSKELELTQSKSNIEIKSDTEDTCEIALNGTRTEGNTVEAA
eukprot:TRINITY_DN1698_c0_g1_i11.p1 TRINITY_DN1698_c0_g1~~TRINITY_DN1698_c0_g1_i11.p1  ORF type:complete len:384 (+),score=47.13 TRINITY_DN1698_c0_g1_i11:363-1514(+)